MIKLNRRTLLLLTITWYILIWVISSIHMRSLSTLDQLNLDKAAHLGVYLILGLLSNRVLTGYRKGLLFTIMIYAVLLLSAALDEYHQVWVTNRMVSVYDMFANQLGLLIGLTIYMLYDRRKRP